MSPKENQHQYLEIQGVRENNLKSLRLRIEHNKFTVLTGVSGSGKSSLAFDTIYAEGARRYIETFSPYTRQFLDRLHRPDFDTIKGVRPALALEQRNRLTSSRSTVGTITEINDYLKIIWAHLAELKCPDCGIPVRRDTPQEIIKTLSNELSGATATLAVAFPVACSGQASVQALASTLQAEGFLRFYSPADGTIRGMNELENLSSQDEQLLIVVDRLKSNSSQGLESENFRQRLRSSLVQSYSYGHGRLAVIVLPEDDSPSRAMPQEYWFSEGYCCAQCRRSFSDPKPAFFSFNSPLGACKTCHGFGRIIRVDPELVIPNPGKSINQGALACWAHPATTHELRKLKKFCLASSIDLDASWSELSAAQQESILYGPKEKSSFKGLERWFKKLEKKRHKVHVRVFLSRYRSEFQCSDCRASRLIPYALWFSIHGHTLPQIWQMPLSRVLEFFKTLAAEHSEDEVTEIAVEEAVSRLEYLCKIGLEYLTLDRQSRTLSGGEFQRVNLATILGARLVHTTLILDEPTIGLHASDTYRLLNTLQMLKERDNTVVVVEHDPEVIRAADEVIDLGPLSGSAGGEIVYQGSLPNLMKCKSSLTAKYLNLLSKPRALRAERQKDSKEEIIILGACANNLAAIDVHIPLGKLVVLSGLSGSGKSTLVHNCLYSPYERYKNGIPLERIASMSGKAISGIKGLELVDDIVLVDQQPIGKTPRSNPATYTKIWELIRECLAETPSAQQLGLSKSAFSFNVDGGRCPTCKGAGHIRIEMQFLADVFVPCEACAGVRFQDQVLGVRFAGKNVSDFLEMSLNDTAQLFASLGLDERTGRIAELLNPLLSLGLGYLRLGHPLSIISGGEAQRIKLASYLTPNFRQKCLFILDEPTTGLHAHNVADLIAVFRTLISRGHSLLVIEHNLEVLAEAEWLIDLGPGGGEKGGRIVAQGRPAELAKNIEQFPESATSALLARRYHLASEVRSSAVHYARKAKIASREFIEVVGARHHNLKNVSAKIPHQTLSVITGVSGSGKSTLAFDIVFAEGQRRYIDCLSPYARQYIKQLSKADVDRVRNIPPTIAISQKTAPPMGVSTIATTTEIYQYLRLLYAKTGAQHCTRDDTPITSLKSESITAEISRRFKGKRILLFAPVVSGRKGYYNDLFNRALKAELTQARIDGKVVQLHPELRLERHKLHDISLAVGSLKNPTPDSPMLQQAVEQCLLLGNGAVEVFEDDAWGEPQLFSVARVCPKCGSGYRELDPQDFSFRSARGVCRRCSGRGSIAQRKNSLEQSPCPECGGARIGPIGRHVYLEGRRIDELTALNARDLLAFFEDYRFPARLEAVVNPLLRELKSRLSLIISVGLDYLELAREASSISGGEAQRLRLARALGSPLSGVCYVLDEPSIGLHSQDQQQLMQTLFGLRDQGNTVMVVEHDEDTIRQADYIVDVGPRGGADGGKIVVCGTLAEVESCPESLTGEALRQRSRQREKIVSMPRKQDGGKLPSIVLRGACAHNLKNITAKFPLHKLTVVAGVSGAGKSSLVHGTLVPAIIEKFSGERERKKQYQKTWASIEHLEPMERLTEIDQSPVGKTPSSAPASFLGVFDEIRKLYAMLPEARSRGWSASHFSFNTGKGRCPECQGRGLIKIPMSFLPEASNTCESCNGLRYNEETLEVLYQGISLGQLLQKTMTEARGILANHAAVSRALEYVLELGLGYLTLGQPTHTLSGGEAQRLKIARELGKREAKQSIYILDEPTIGLHMIDVERLRKVLQKLVDFGNTVIVIEHNLDIIRSADYLIELGPGPGEAGGRIVFAGAPDTLKSATLDTPTKRSLFPQAKRSRRGAVRSFAGNL